MPISVSSPADVCNLALSRLGSRLRIGSLYEGSDHAKKFLDIYSQTRDAVLLESDWDFAERNVSLTALKVAPVGGYPPGTPWTPAYPPLPWMFEYPYPSDCLRVRAVKTTPIFLPNPDPVPHHFSIDNDSSFSPSQKVILCNIPQAILVYTGQVTDPLDWNSDFVEALASALGRRLALMGFGSPEAPKLEPQDEGAELSIGRAERG